MSKNEVNSQPASNVSEPEDTSTQEEAEIKTQETRQERAARILTDADEFMAQVLTVLEDNSIKPNNETAQPFQDQTPKVNE